MNCGPSSDHNKSGTAVRQNWSLRAEISLVVVVSFPISMISGQLVLQSTKVRRIVVLHVMRSQLLSVLGGFRVMGSLACDGKRS